MKNLVVHYFQRPKDLKFPKRHIGVGVPKLGKIHSTTAEELVDVCVGTSVGTITEPDCLGPCEPGTSVTLEGIVWHETEGVLVVNVTWRGKTYVGTLLDCTRHDWAPPRFCDSPTSDMDARTPKGRGKRGRTAAHSSLNDLSNFTETRSSVHSKLRSNNANLPKGRRGPGAASPTPFATPKADATPGKRKTKTNEEEPAPKRKAPPSQPTSPLPPPTLLECPEPNCSKKYKHINGLKYHQSHAHGNPDDDETKESATSEEEEPTLMPEVAKKEEPCETTTQSADDTLGCPPDLDEKPLLKYPDEQQQSPAEPSPPILATPTPPIIIPTTPPPPAPSPPPPPVEENVNLSILSQPPVLTKVPQFKVKPASALMSEEKKLPVSSPPNIPKQAPQTPPAINQKKKNRKSPTGSPDSTLPSPPGYEELEGGREEVQSPAYSDISDDGAPVLESEVEGKSKPSDKKEESSQLQHFGIYPYYGQPPYLVPSVSEKPKDPVPEKVEGKSIEKDKKDTNPDYQQKMLPQHYYQYGYHVPGFSYNMDGYPVVVDDKKDEKASPSSANTKTANNSTLHIPNPAKPKIDPVITKEKHQNDNHQILKESIDMKNQVNPGFLYHRQPNRPQEDVGGYYSIYPDRKEGAPSKATPPPPKTLPSPSPKHKEKPEDKKERREEEKKQEGVKPTMETQGPPPPPTSQYAYIHPGYMQSPHYGTLPFEPAVYRGMNPMLVSGYPNSHYLHPQLHAVPRYAPEDLSRSQSGKALDLLQHHASQYYAPSHKIHELQERAIKSPTPKTTTATPSPSSVAGPISTPVTSSAAVQVQGKSSVTDAKDARSPPPQRHVHTHHHTHVGLGYPILAGNYPAPYGAAVLATEHAAAVTSVPYQAK
ncbi:hypothetical protein GE061_001617 [Apolygus lucorum]|uniref:C2H2-type domain-containing protein n=1 Tax=Apolygus lucorum TaxID=248454 RepID=A0A8S9Y7V0_APOLU|nr:hypothetical protein GE061_001617 [Apolygus lucorum]